MTLFVVQAKGRDEDALARARFIEDGFSWRAFVFGPFWLLYHRLWLALVVWIVLEGTFFVLIFPHVSGETATAIDLLAHLFIGFEGNRLRQQKGARAAALTDLVEARDRDEAEMIFYRRHVPGSPEPDSPMPDSTMPGARA